MIEFDFEKHYLFWKLQNFVKAEPELLQTDHNREFYKMGLVTKTEQITITYNRNQLTNEYFIMFADKRIPSGNFGTEIVALYSDEALQAVEEINGKV